VMVPVATGPIALALRGNNMTTAKNSTTSVFVIGFRTFRGLVKLRS